MSKAADQDTMREIHRRFADRCKKILTDGQKVLTKDGEIEEIDPQPATLNSIRQFLKDNGIEADIGGADADEVLAAKLKKLVPEDLDDNSPYH